MTDESKNKNQEEIEELLEQVRSSDDQPAESEANASADAANASVDSPDDSAGAPGEGEPVQESASVPEELAQEFAPSTIPQAEGGHPGPQSSSPPASSSSVGNDIDYLLRQTQEALGSIDSPAHSELEGLVEFQLREFPGTPPSTEHATLDLLRDVELDLKIELGRTHMYLDEVLRLKRGSVVPLDKLAGDPVDVYVNGRLVARGEVLVLNDNFCVRVAELISGNEVD